MIMANLWKRRDAKLEVYEDKMRKLYPYDSSVANNVLQPFFVREIK